MFGSTGPERSTFLANRLLQWTPSTQSQQPFTTGNVLLEAPPSLGLSAANQGNVFLRDSMQELANIQRIITAVTGPHGNLPDSVEQALLKILQPLQQTVQQQVATVTKITLEQKLEPLKVAIQILSNTPPSLAPPSFRHTA